MKKTYVAAAVIWNGTVLNETLSGAQSGAESDGKFPLTAGRVGFYL